MKRVKMLIAILMVFISVTTIGVTAFASEAETPKTEYHRNGITYRMSSQLLEEADPAFNKYLLKISKEIFEEEPMIYVYNIEESLNSILGFQVKYDDGSRAIYLKVQPYWKAVQVFVHEMVHYKYNIEKSTLYKQNRYGNYVYTKLMEQITDEIAKNEYSKFAGTIIYQKAYTSEIFEKIIEEDTDDILISLYKGEYNLSNAAKVEVEEALSELQEAENVESARDAFKKIKEKLKWCPKIDGHLFFYEKGECNGK